MPRPAVVFLTACLIGAICGTGCIDRGERAAHQLDAVARSVERYGFASISAPFLSGRTRAFKFDLNKPASYFFEQAFKPQGGFATRDFEALDAQLSIRVNVEQALASIAQLEAARSTAEFREAKRQVGVQYDTLAAVSAATPGFSELPQVTNALAWLNVARNAAEPEAEAFHSITPTTQPVPNTGEVIPVDDRLALKAVGGAFGLTQLASLPHANAYQISAREALLIAAGDTITQSLLSWFLEPAGNKLKNYELFFCPVIVSVQPGWDTRNGYQADVTVTVDLARRKPDGTLEYLADKYSPASPPLQVAGVFPVIDAQVLDLQSSRRRLASLALQLAMVGFGAEANFLVDYAKKLESDAQTQSSLTTASAYTLGSSAFGFRVEPQKFALNNALQLNAEPGESLQSKSFPAMAVLLVNRDFLLDRDEDAEREACKPLRKGNTCLPDGAYEFVSFRSSVRWTPLKKPAAFVGSRFSEVEAWKRSRALDDAHSAIDEKSDAANGGQAASDSRTLGLFERENLNARFASLRQAAIGAQSLVRVQSTGPRSYVRVDSVEPSRGWLDQWTVLTVTGSGFGGGNVQYVTVGGRGCEFEVVDDSSMIVLVPPWGSATATPPIALAADITSTPGSSSAASFAGSSGMPRPNSSLGGDRAGEAHIRPDSMLTVDLSELLAAANTNSTEPLTESEFEHLIGLTRKAATSELSTDEQKLLASLRERERRFAIPLSPTEEKQLQDLTKREVVKDPPITKEEIERLAQLRERERYLALRSKRLAAEKTEADQLAEVVIAAARPIYLGEKPPATTCTTTCASQPATPKCKANVGTVRFSKSVASPAPSANAKDGEVIITRGDGGVITGVKTVSGFANGTELLRLIVNQLKLDTTGTTQIQVDGGFRANVGGPTTITDEPK